MMLKIRYNSPVILTFAISSVVVYLLDTALLPGLSHKFFTCPGYLQFSNPLTYFQLVSYPLGHADWNHLIGNMTFILLLGPILEEKYNSGRLLLMMIITAIITGLISALIFHSGLIGASGIVFMLIILASIVDFRRGSIPLTFVLIAFIFIGTEVINAFAKDNISQMAHILGGACGACFGFAKRF